MEERLRSRSNAVWRLSLVLVFTWITFILISITLLWSLYAVRQELLSHLSRLENAGLNMACDCLRLQEQCCTEGKGLRASYKESLETAMALALTRKPGEDAKKLKALNGGKDGRKAEETNVQLSNEDNSKDISVHFRHAKRREIGLPKNESSKLLENADVKGGKPSVHQGFENSETVKGKGSDVLGKANGKSYHIKSTENYGGRPKNESNNGFDHDMDPSKRAMDAVMFDSTKTRKTAFKEGYSKDAKDEGKNHEGERAVSIDVEQDTSLSVSNHEDGRDDLEDGMGSGCDECGLKLRTYIKNVVKDTQMSMTKTTPKAMSPTCRCRNVTTDWNTTYNIGISKFLESHTIKCNDNEFLQSIVFRGNKDEFFPLYRYEFRCCRIFNTHE